MPSSILYDLHLALSGSPKLLFSRTLLPSRPVDFRGGSEEIRERSRPQLLSRCGCATWRYCRRTVVGIQYPISLAGRPTDAIRELEDLQEHPEFGIGCILAQIHAYKSAKSGGQYCNTVCRGATVYESCLTDKETSQELESRLREERKNAGDKVSDLLSLITPYHVLLSSNHTLSLPAYHTVPPPITIPYYHLTTSLSLYHHTPPYHLPPYHFITPSSPL